MNDETMENLDSETQDGEGEIVESDSEQEEETTESSQEDLVAQERKKFEDQKKRAEKAEQELKRLKAERAEKTKSEPKKVSEPEGQQSDTLSREEAILFAKGLSEDEVEKAKSIARVEGVNPLVAAESGYFKFWKSEQEKKREVEETQLGTSTGSPKIKPKKDFTTPGLSKEEHMALWKQSLGR